MKLNYIFLVGMMCTAGAYIGTFNFMSHICLWIGGVAVGVGLVRMVDDHREPE